MMIWNTPYDEDGNPQRSNLQATMARTVKLSKFLDEVAELSW